MKPYLTYIFVLLALFFSKLNHAQVEAEVKYEGIKGKVKSVKTVYFSIDDEGIRHENHTTQSNYTSKGFKSFYKSGTNSDKKYLTQTTYVLDERENPIEMNIFGRDSILQEKRKRVFNLKDQLVEESYFSINGRLSQKHIYSYDERGNEIEKQIWMTDTYFLLKQVKEYDLNNNLLSLKNYNIENILTYEYLYKYDSENRKTESSHWQLGILISKKSIYSYNSKNKNYTITNYENDIIIYVSSYQYDEFENLIMSEYINKRNNRKSVTKSKFNQNKDKIEELSFENDVQTDKKIYQYKYDENNNWIQNTEFQNDGSPTYQERLITYY